MLAKLKADINSGQAINELEAIYLPLFSSKTLSPTELFLESAEIVKVMQASEERKHKVLSLLITLSGKIVDHDKILELIEEVRKMGNVIIEVFEEIGRESGRKLEKEAMAKKMLDDNCDILDIIKYTELSPERLREIRDSVKAEAAAQA